MLPDRIYFNLPHVFKRSNISFTNLDKLPYLNHSLIYINPCEDLGPVTKLLPTLELETDPRTLIVVVDDDIYYPVHMLETIYEAAVKNPVSPIVVHCGSKGTIVNKEKEFSYRSIVTLDDNYPVCRFFDQFAGVGYRREAFYLHVPHPRGRSLSFDEYMNISLANSRCFRSDDLVISNFFALAGVPGVGLNRLINPHSVRPLHYSMNKDALHNLEPSGHPYFRCSVYLHQMGVRSLTVKPPFELHAHVVESFVGIWEYDNKSAVILPKNDQTDFIRHFVIDSTMPVPFNYSLIRDLYQAAINVSLPIYSDNPTSQHYSPQHMEDLSYVHTMLQFVYSGKPIKNIYREGAIFRLHKGSSKEKKISSSSAFDSINGTYVFLDNEKHFLTSADYLVLHGLRLDDIVEVGSQFDIDIIPTGMPI